MVASPVTPVEAANLSVQGQNPNAALLAFYSSMSTSRRPLLPQYGTQERERALRRLYRNPYNTLIQGSFAGIANKIISTPFEMSAPTEAKTQNAQEMLRLAHFGKGFEYLFSVTVLNYLRHDRGAYWELIGYGNPDAPLVGYPVAVAALDPLRCYPTGDREYPVYYYSTRGSYHRLHRTRVHPFVDMPDGDEDYPDVGLCALSRAVAIADREIAMGRYVSVNLDDKPKPGVAIASNLSSDERDRAYAQLRAERGADERPEWGETVWMFGISPNAPVDVEFKSFAEAPEKFDFVNYVNLDVSELALALGVDKQELWELTGGGIGTGTQSQILAAKSRGKTIGKLYKMMERALNLRVLPADCEFAFKYRDAQQDAEQANIANLYTSIAIQLEPLIGKRAALQMLANQVEPLRDVLLDEAGRVRLPDDDVQPAKPQVSVDDSAERNSTPTDAATTDDTPPDDPFANEKSLFASILRRTVALDERTRKAWSDTSSQAVYEFVRLVYSAETSPTSRRVLTSRLRRWLKQWGDRAYLDGMEEGGIKEPTLDDDDRATVQAWLARQNVFTTAFSKEVSEKGLSDLQIAQRAAAWVENSLGEIKQRGLLSVKANALFKWVWLPTAEHCKSCRRLNGQIHRLKDWMRYNLRPKSPQLQCWVGCKCTLVPATNEKATGKLGRVPLANRKAATDYHAFCAAWDVERAHHHAA